MANSKIKDKLKQMKIERVLKFIKEHARYFVAGGLFVVMAIVLATCAGEKSQGGSQENQSGNVVAEEYQVDAYEDVNNLIVQYYAAYAAGDMTTLTGIATPVSANEQSYITMFSQYVEEYQNIRCYTKSGLDADSYLVSVEMEIKFTGVDTPAPGLDFFYVRTTENGSLYIDNLYSQYNLSNQENALDTSIQNLIYGFENEEDFVELQNDVQTRYDAAVAADVNLSTMIYTTIPTAIDTWVTQVAMQNAQNTTDGTDVSAEPTEVLGEPGADATAVEEETPTEEAPAEENATEIYYTTDKVNVRAEASTDGEKLGSLEKGTAIGVIAVADDWAHVNYGGYDGYIKLEFLTKDTPDAAHTDTDAAEENTDSTNLTEGTTITLQNTVNIRSGMSETSDRIGTAYAGEKVKVVMSYAEGWTKVTWNNKTGYIKSSLLQ